MMEHVGFLKTIFIIRSAGSNYPVIIRSHYENMIRDWDLLDAGFDMDQAIRIFISVTKNMDKRLAGTLSEKDLSRMMFYEAIVRIAFFKYKLPGTCETVIESLKKLMKTILKPANDNHEWMPWRTDKLWVLDIDDLFKTNMVAMKKLWSYYFKVKKVTTFYLEDCQNMFTKDIDLNLLPEQVSSCFGLAKMTVNSDIAQRKVY